MSAGLFGHAIKPNFCLGISIVLISMHQFFTAGGAQGASKASSAVDAAKGGGGAIAGTPPRPPSRQATLTSAVGAAATGLAVPQPGDRVPRSRSYSNLLPR